ncbi:MAG TPA: aldo/keto reductase [Longimicrobiales bacterium]|nr:aldo/keto reductase [Longimicrobiales bacterium]
MPNRDRMLSRRRALELGAGALAAATFSPSLLASPRPTGARSGATAPQEDLILKRIPRSGEQIPAIGMGTWQTFDVGSNPSERAALLEVLRSFHRLGGRVIDSSPMYGNSEEVFGDLAVESGLSGDFWVATKVWIGGRAAGVEQMETSMSLLRRPSHIELMQVHNLRDVEVHLDTLDAWKLEGRFDYIGVTTSSERQYDDVAALLEAEGDRIDFLQINYSLGERTSAERILPMAQERGIAVMINRPFAGGRLFGAVGDRPLPEWASEFGCEAWSQFFLKYIISHPAVTCAIPATSDPEHLAENMGGGRGGLPDEETRRRMEEVVG